MKIIRMLVMGIFLTGSLLQADVSQLYKANFPTEYSQCDDMRSQNYTNQNELHRRHMSCSRECLPSTCNGWKVASSCIGWSGETFGSCVSLLEDYCRFANQAEDALRECREKVAQYKNFNNLRVSAEEAAKEEMNQFLERLKNGVIDIASPMLKKPAKKLFKQAVNTTVTYATGARKQLDDAIDAWAPGSSRLALPTGYLGYHDTKNDAVYSALLALHSTNGNNLIAHPSYPKQDEFNTVIMTARLLEREGDVRAAYLLGKAINNDFWNPRPTIGDGINLKKMGFENQQDAWKQFSSLAHFLNSAAGGYLPAVDQVASQMLNLGYLQNAEDWLQLGAENGSEWAKKQVMVLREFYENRKQIPQQAQSNGSGGQTPPIRTTPPPSDQTSNSTSIEGWSFTCSIFDQNSRWNGGATQNYTQRVAIRSSLLMATYQNKLVPYIESKGGGNEDYPEIPSLRFGENIISVNKDLGGTPRYLVAITGSISITSSRLTGRVNIREGNAGQREFTFDCSRVQ